MAPAAIVYVRADPIPHSELRARLDRIERLLVQIGRAVIAEGAAMSELDDDLTALETAVDQLTADETRELADLQALKDAGQTLTGDQEQRLTALLAKVQADDAAINAADPAPAEAAAEPASADETLAA